jgi:hypothetical protein
MSSHVVHEHLTEATKSNSVPEPLFPGSVGRPYFWPGPDHPRLTPALAKLIEDHQDLDVLMSTISVTANSQDLLVSGLKEQLSQRYRR